MAEEGRRFSKYMAVATGKCLSPVRCKHVRMDEHGAAYVVQCAKNVFGLAILWESVWT